MEITACYSQTTTQVAHTETTTALTTGTTPVVGPPSTPAASPSTPSKPLSPGTPSAVPSTGTPSGPFSPGTPSGVPSSGTPSAVPPPGTPTVVGSSSTPSVAPSPSTPSKPLSPGTPSAVPSTGTPNGPFSPGTPSGVPSSTTPLIGTPIVVPTPGTPAVVRSPGTPSVSPLTSSKSLSPEISAIVPASGTPSTVPPPGTPTVVKSPGTPSIVPPPGTPSIASTSIQCEPKVLGFGSGNVAVTASSSAGSSPFTSLSGSGGFWSPSKDDAEKAPFLLLEVLSTEDNAKIVSINFNIKYSPAVAIALIDSDNSVVGVQRSRPNKDSTTPVSFADLNTNARYVKLYTTVAAKSPPPQVGGLEIKACFQFKVTTYPPHVTTSIRSACQPDEFTCHNGKCVNRTQICDGTFNCEDRSDEEKCATATVTTVTLSTAPTAWSSWSPWSECSVTCGEGVQIRNRVCRGQDCDESTKEERKCSEAACACYFSQEDFETQFGYQGSNPIGWIEKDGLYGLTSDDEKVEINDEIEDGVVVHVDCNNCTCDSGFIGCSNQTCQRDCRYTEWTSWSECTKTCDVGQRSRTRDAIPGTLEGKPCVDPTQELEDCNTDNCPESPEWSSWSLWTKCSVTCNGGVTTRTRTCLKSGGKVNEEQCEGEALESESCNSNPCTTGPPTCEEDKVYKNCSEKCPRTCQELRLPSICVEPEVCQPGCACADGQVEYRGQCIPEAKCPCYDEKGNEVPEGIEVKPSDCQVCSCKNGNYTCQEKENCSKCTWSDWTSWGGCSVTCGEGTKTRYRTHTGNGTTCEGQTTETIKCELDQCPPACFLGNSSYSVGELVSEDQCTECYCREGTGVVCSDKQSAIVDGGFTEWSDWSQCSSDCVGGIKKRTRTCTNPLPQCGGKPCQGDNAEQINCNSDVPCCVKSEWTEWSECSATCDGGTQSRERTVNGTNCPTPDPQTRPCNTRPCNETCKTTAWDNWSACSVTCGVGQKTRTRQLIGSSEGCSSELEEVEGCYEGACACVDANEVWSNHTYCERTCDNRFDVLNKTMCDMVKEGCACAEGFFRKDGKCVKSSTCDVCVVSGEVKTPGATWPQPNDKCYVCECVAGEEICSRQCEIPTCADGEELSYEVPNVCCPKCVPVPETCSLHTRQDYLIDEISGCRSLEEVIITSCSGGCGSSSYSPMLMMSRDGAGPQSSCKCCTGDVTEVKAVQVECGDLKIRREAFYPILGGCRCNACAGGLPVLDKIKKPVGLKDQ